MPRIRQLVTGLDYNAYHEPFLGGGATFLGLSRLTTAYLNDANAELIDMYIQIKNSPREVFKAVQNYNNTAECYYELRASTPVTDIERAAKFIFLNHTSFNGIYRVNLKGQYNVPFGARKSIKLPTEEHLLDVSTRLRHANLTSVDFAESLKNVTENDLVFLDPPYTVSHNNNGFIKYNQKLFSFDDQIRLRESIDRIVERGAFFVMTNAAHYSIDELFSSTGRKLVVSRGNSIGGIKAARGRADEYLFTNLSMGEK